MAMTRDDFDYAIENTRVIVAPERQIATFGSTSFDFYLISELMDRVDQVRFATENPRRTSTNSHAGALLPAIA
jgi:hypothetical protein